MNRFIQILLISLATLILVANNVVFRYIEKSSIVAFDDQNDEEGKTEKNNLEEKVKEFFSSIFTDAHIYYTKSLNTNFFITDNNRLPSILLDVELLPPNLG